MTSDEDSPPLAVAGLHVVRRGQARPFSLPDLRLPPAGAAALLGSSGCGKTSLLLAIAGLLEPSVVVEGRIETCGTLRAEPGSPRWRQWLRDDVAVVMQDARAALDPLDRLGDQLAVAAGGGVPALAEALRVLGIDDPEALLRRYPHQVSGGQAQRCLMAVALARRPKLLLADEPNASLDEGHSAEMIAALQRLRAEADTALLLATHDHAVVEQLAAAPLVQDDAGAFRPAALELPPWPRFARSAVGDRVALSCRDVGVHVGGRWLLRDVTMTLRQGEVLAVLGPSGAGKTTLAKVLAGHLRPSCGTVARPPRRTAVQMLFQGAHASLTPHRPIAALVREVAPRGFDLAAAAAELELPAALLARSREQLSGGERRRAALLRALSVAPDVLILDEPTASLDRRTGVPVMAAVLQAQQRRGLSCLLITHDSELAAAVADRVVEMEGGCLRAGAWQPAEEACEEP